MNREPGWYNDPFFHERERYWDGSNWSDEVRMAPTKQPVPAPPKQEAATTSGSAAAARENRTTASTAAAAAAAAARTSDQVRTSDPVTATYPKSEPLPNDPMITGVVPAQAPPQPDDPMITGVVPAQSRPQPDDPMITGIVPAAPTGSTPRPPTEAPAPAGGRTVSGSVPPTPPPAAKVADESPLMQISSRPVNPLSDPLTTMNIAPAKDRPSRRRWILLAGAAVVVLVVVAVGAYLAFGASSSSAGGSAQVAKAAHHILHKKSVDVSLTVKVVSTGSSDLTGSGAFDLASDSGTMTMTPVDGGSRGTEQMLFVGQTVYVSFSNVSVLEPGKRWISADVTELGSASSAIGSDASSIVKILGNPAASVQQLESSGLTVTSLGSSTYDGTPVQGYRVVLNGSAVDGVSAGSHSSETIYVTSKHHLLVAIVVPVTVDTSGGPFPETLTLSFTNYGTPVSVATPAPSEVVSLGQYESIQNAAPGG